MTRNSCGHGSMKLTTVNMTCSWILERRSGKTSHLANSYCLMIFLHDFVIFRAVKSFDKDIWVKCHILFSHFIIFIFYVLVTWWSTVSQTASLETYISNSLNTDTASSYSVLMKSVFYKPWKSPRWKFIPVKPKMMTFRKVCQSASLKVIWCN